MFIEQFTFQHYLFEFMKINTLHNTSQMVNSKPPGEDVGYGFRVVI